MLTTSITRSTKDNIYRFIVLSISCILYIYNLQVISCIVSIQLFNCPNLARYFNEKKEIVIALFQNNLFTIDSWLTRNTKGEIGSRS